MVHESPAGLDDDGCSSIVGDMDCDGEMDSVRLSDDVEVMVGATHSHVLH